MPSPIRIAILANASQARREISSTERELGGFSKATRRLALSAGAYFSGAAVVAGVKSIVSAASDAQQSIGATETVYGKYAAGVIRDSNKAANAVGLSANEYRENANVLGALLKNQGVAADQLAGKTKGLIKVGADLAATYGGTTREAVEALSSAYKGEFDPLERYGISIKQSTINTEAAKVAQKEYGKALTALTPAQQNAAKQQATSNLIARQGAAAQGQFARESDSLAHKQQVAAAKFDNLKAKLGNALLPIMTKVFDYVGSTVIPALSRFVSGMQNGTGAGGTFAGILRTVGGVLGSVVGFLIKHKTLVVGIVAAYAAWRTISAIINAVKVAQAAYVAITYGAAGATYATGAALTIYNVAMKAVAIGTKAYTAAQWLLNAALTANPIGLIVAAIALLIAGLVLAYKKSETFRNIVNGAFTAIKNIVTKVVGAVVGFVKSHWQLLVGIIAGPLGLIVGLVVKNWGKIKAFISTALAVVKAVIGAAWSFVTSRTSAAWNRLVSLISGAIGRAVGFVRGLKAKVIGVFAGAVGWLVGSGQKIIQGLIDGIVSMGKKVAGAVGGVLKKARDLLPFSPARTGPFSGRGWTLYSGRSISEGLAQGILERAGTVQSAAKRLAAAAVPVVPDLRDTLAASASDARAALSTSSSQTITIELKLTAEQLNQLQRGKAIQADLDALARAGGRPRA